MEESTFANELFFRSVFEQASVGVAIINSKTKQFTQINQKFCEIIGYSQKETLKLSFVDITHPEDINSDLNNMKLLLEETISSFTIEKRYIKKDGTVVWVNISVSPLWVKGTKEKELFNIGIIQDITTQKQDAEALKLSNERFFEIINSSIMPMAMNDSDGKITFLSSTFVETFGYTLEDIPTLKHWWPAAYPDIKYKKWVASSWKNEIERSKQSGRNFSPLEVKIKCKNGTIKTVLCSASKFSNANKEEHLVIFYDITERKLALDKLKESEATFKSVVQNSLNLTTLSDENDRLIFASPQCKEVLGFSGETFLGKKLPITIHPDDIETFQQKWKNLKTKGEIINHHEYRIIKNEGKIDWLSQSAKPVEVDGKTICFQSSIRNITERKLTEIELKESKAKFQFIVEKSDDILWVMNADLNMEYVSPSVINVLGYTPEEHMNQRIEDYMAPESAEMIKYEFQQGIINLMKKDFDKLRTNVELEVQLIRKDKTVRDAIITLLITRDKHYHIEKIRGKTTDITEQKKSEKLKVLSTKVLAELNGAHNINAMIESVLQVIKEETKFSAIGVRLKSGNDFPYLSQIGFSDDFLLTENSLVVKNKYGELRTDKNGKPLLECTCGLVLNGITEESKPFFTPYGSFWTNESYPLLKLTTEQDPRLRPRNKCIHLGFGSIAIIPIKTNDITIGTLQLNEKGENAFTKEMIDVFENICLSIGNTLLRKLAENATKESETNLSAVFENTNTGFILLNTKGSIISFNNRANQLAKLSFGKSLQINNELKEFLPAQRQKTISASLQKAIAGNEMHYDVPYPQSIGRTLWLDITIKPVYNDDREIVGTSFGILNITKRKEAEQEKEKLIQELSDKNNELMQFNYIVSHNLRAPLTNLQGLSNLLGLPGNTEQEKIKIVEHMKQAVNNMDALIKDLHVILSTRSAINITKENVVIKTLLKSISNTLELQIKQSDCIINTKIQKNAAHLFTVKSYLESILYNLISNAIKYRSDQRILQIDIVFKKQGNSYVITVSDNGIGIDLSIHGNYIFGLYKRFHLKVEGKGLGLHMTKTQVEAIGGKITVESTVNKGSSFTIILPVS